MLERFKRLVGIKPRKEISHPTFGKLLFFELKAPGTSYWEGEVHVEGHPEPVSLAIVAGESGPTASQEEFFRLIASDFSSVVFRCSPILKADYEQWCNKPYPTEFLQEFKWVGLTIPRDGNDSNPWDISFDCASDTDHQFTVYFENGKAATGSVDG